MFDISRLQGQHRALTEQHIDQGIKEDCSHCPVAMVLSEMVNDRIGVEVDGSDSVKFYAKDDPRKDIGKIFTSGTLDDWIWRFDRDMSVKPGVLFIYRIKDNEDGDSLWVGFSEGSPLTYHPIPEEMTAHIVFTDGSTALWEAHGGEGSIDFLETATGRKYYTVESLKRRGVRTFVLINRYEVEVD